MADLYDVSTGRPSIDPEVALRLTLAGFLAFALAVRAGIGRRAGFFLWTLGGC